MSRGDDGASLDCSPTMEAADRGHSTSTASGVGGPLEYPHRRRYALLVLNVDEDGRQILGVREQPDDVDVVVGDEVEPSAREAADATDP